MNSDYRKYPRTNARQIINYDNVIAGIGEKGIYCINKGVLQILRYLISTRGLWRTSYSISSNNDGYLIPNIEQFEPIRASIAEFLDGGDMSCDIVDAIDRLGGRLDNCCTQGYVGTQTVDGKTYYGTAVPRVAPSTFGGATDDFETEAAYDSHRCLAATSIVNALYSDLQVLGAFASFQYIASGGLAIAAMSGVLTIPAVPLLLACGAAGLVTGLLVALKDEIDFDELKCIIYNSDSAVAAYDNIQENLTEVGVSLWGVGITANLVVDLVMSMASIDALNGMFSLFTYFDDGEADCSDCVECNEVLLSSVYGEYDGLSTFSSDYYAGGWGGVEITTAYFRIREDGSRCGPMVNITGITVNYGNPNYWYFVGDDGNPVYLSEYNTTVPQVINNVRWFQVRRHNAPIEPFSVTIHWE